ncbi:hypothetical protein, partial [Slackia equolifaciens]|uniref:hypothetical protein n=1 Tax=Slackia equolifaciens TaxID=498718 RepID=UPI001C65BE7F
MRGKLLSFACEIRKRNSKTGLKISVWDCGRKVGRDSRVRKGVRMYDRDVVELALLALEEGMTHAEAA